MSALKKINKRQKTLLYLTTFFGLCSTHFNLYDADTTTYAGMMITVLFLMLMVWQSERSNIKAWETIDRNYDTQDEFMGAMFDNMKKIVVLQIKINHLEAELKKNKAFLKTTSGLTVIN